MKTRLWVLMRVNLNQSSINHQATCQLGASRLERSWAHLGEIGEVGRVSEYPVETLQPHVRVTHYHAAAFLGITKSDSELSLSLPHVYGAEAVLQSVLTRRSLSRFGLRSC